MQIKRFTTTTTTTTATTTTNNNNSKCLYCALDKNTYPMLQDKKIKSSAKLQ